MASLLVGYKNTSHKISFNQGFWSGAFQELLYLYLLHSEVQEGVLVTDADQALGALTSHAGTQASIQFHHHQFVQAVGHIVRQASSGNLIIRLNLEERKEMAAGQEKKQTNKK